jgi:cytochrome c biogenesis protein CcmG/thiol:disulfide interchange protein DsbE
MTDRRLAIGGLLALTTLAALGSYIAAQRRATPAQESGGAGTVTEEKIALRFYKNPTPVANVALQTLDGQTLSSSTWRGKVTLVNFWATWCPPCKAEIPDLIALQNKYRDQLQIIGISEDDTPDVVRRFVAEFKINYPVVMVTPEILRAFPGVASLPTTFMLDRDGRIAVKHVGLLRPNVTEQETRALAGLTVNASIERVEPDKAVGLTSTAHVKEIPGVDLKRLSSEQRATALQRLNAEACTCGCELTVAKCRIDDPSCSVSLPLARQIVENLASAGKS